VVFKDEPINWLMVATPFGRLTAISIFGYLCGMLSFL
jgi:hypothetical protein